MIRLFYSLLFILMTLSVQGQLLQDLSLKYLIQLPQSKVVNSPVIILLHGYGSNESDLFELKDLFPGKYTIVSVRAPYAVSGQGFQWFALGAPDSKEIFHSRELILKFISEISGKYNIDSRNIYLIGFSQGAMMSYDVGLSHPDKIKGIAPLSGRLFKHLKNNQEARSNKLKLLKIFIAHGTADDRIPFAEAQTAEDYLKRIGLTPEFHSYKGLGHSISNDEIKDLIHWLQ